MATMTMQFADGMFVAKSAIDEELAWRLVMARDAAADARFVYAVSSTGVYCRPSCASRRPRRENVRFFVQPAEAEAEGYRACLRCRPLEVRRDAHAKAVARAAGAIAKDRTLDEAAAAAGMGRFAMQRGFKRVLGVTPGEFARGRRQERFRTALQRAEGSVTEAVYAAGFGSSSRVYEDAGAMLGMSPTAMRAGGAGERIGYAIAGSPLGTMLVAATERGLCAVLFADSVQAAEADLRARFPKAELRRDEAALRDAVALVMARLDETESAAEMPFHVRATAFQQRVWAALRAIPRGETRTYAEIAEAIGAPKAVRAVGTACGANPLAVVVPCHRVVGKDGSLTGYRWGTERKRRLLERESAVQAGDEGLMQRIPDREADSLRE